MTTFFIVLYLRYLPSLNPQHACPPSPYQSTFSLVVLMVWFYSGPAVFLLDNSVVMKFVVDDDDGSLYITQTLLAQLFLSVLKILPI